MAKERLLFGFNDILEPRKRNNDIVSFCGRNFDPQLAYKSGRIVSPNDIKKLTFESKRLNYTLNELAIALNRDKNELKKEVHAMLEEIGLDKRMFVIRWLATATLKMLCSLFNSVYVNESNMFKLKSQLGLNPVVFVPSHRSYGDFVLTSYVTFTYGMDPPATATGMDFHSMAAMGKIIRDTHGFYIRRSFGADKLYSSVFREYVRTLISKYHATINFFIEGTRSRSGKSLHPKLGFLSMVLEPFFTREIPDITFVPVSISFDRVMEEKLFTYELLGVPKPKESTSGLFRALRVLNENYGNIYYNVGTPFSALEYFGSALKPSIDAIKPVDMRELSTHENKLIQQLSQDIIYKQQMGMVTTTFQLMVTAIMVSLHNEKPMDLEELEQYVVWLSSILNKCGGLTFDYNDENVKEEVGNLLAIHKHTVFIDKDNKVRLINSLPFLMTEEIKKRMKGHQLSEKTMSTILPVFMIQLYLNSILHWLTSPFMLYHIVLKSPVVKVDLWEQYQRIRLLLKFEFPTRNDLAAEFEKGLDDLIALNAIDIDENHVYILGSNEKLQSLLEVLFWPFLSSLHRLSIALCNETVLEEKKLVKSIQEMFEWQLLNKEDLHPYCLSLDCIQNCIQGFVVSDILKKDKKDNIVTYTVNSMQISKLSAWITSLLPKKNMKFYLNNPVIVEPSLTSRL